jgi:hypothetical protein
LASQNFQLGILRVNSPRDSCMSPKNGFVVFVNPLLSSYTGVLTKLLVSNPKLRVFLMETSGFRTETSGFFYRNFGFSNRNFGIFEPIFGSFEPKLRFFENRSFVFLNQSCSFCKDFFCPTETSGVDRNFEISNPYEVSKF